MAGHRIVRALAVAGIGALLPALCLSPTAASAAIHDYSLTLDPSSSFSCQYFAGLQGCATIVPLSSLGYPNVGANPGDTFNVHVDFLHNGSPQALQVPGTKIANAFFASLLDTSGVTAVVPGGNRASIEITPKDFLGPSSPQVSAFDSNFDYLGLIGFGFTSPAGVPNGGFSLTGADVTFNILTADANPIDGIGFSVGSFLKTTPVILTDVQGGPLGNPVPLSDSVGSVSGDISGAGAPTDYYAFQWKGGLFQANATMTGANPLATFDFELFNPDRSIDQQFTLADGNNFSGLLSLVMPAGTYEIGLSTTSPYDPGYAINFLTPLGGVPEPQSWTLAILGLGGLGATLRRRRASVAAG
jgi:hypothetical protein